MLLCTQSAINVVLPDYDPKCRAADLPARSTQSCQPPQCSAPKLGGFCYAPGGYHLRCVVGRTAVPLGSPKNAKPNGDTPGRPSQCSGDAK